MATSPPSPEDFLAADQIAWKRAAAIPALRTLIDDTAVSYPSIKNWTPLLISSQESPVYAANGVYAYAFLTGTRQIVIAFQATADAGQIVKDDYPIAIQQAPPAFPYAEKFVEAVKAKAKDIPNSQIFVTGHSLGGIQAEHLAEKFGYGGVTFGAPGVPGYVNSGASSTLTDYIDRGDPIGNYASDTKAAEPDFAPASKMDHVGTVKILGSQGEGDALSRAVKTTNVGRSPIVLALMGPINVPLGFGVGELLWFPAVWSG
jgi:hypothetical protein